VTPADVVPPCRAQVSAVAPGLFSGRRIASVEVVTRRTRRAVVGRELLFVPGDTVDTLRIAQSLRQVRALGYLGDVQVEARECPGDAGVALRVAARDLGSVSPVLRLRAAGGLVGVRERNLLGTGVGARVALRMDQSRLGVESTVSAPGVPSADASIDVGVVRYRDGSTQFAAVGPRTSWPTRRWIVDGRLAAREQEPRTTPGIVLHRTAGAFLVGRRLPDPADASTYLLAGIEGENASVATGLGTPVLGGTAMDRRYAGLALGIRRAAARFDTTTWLLPNGGLADVPRGIEGDALFSVGRDHAGDHARGGAGGGAAHADLWIGRTATFASGHSILMADGWASGYLGARSLTGSTVRGALTLRHRASNGMWVARVAAERLFAPDPDVRALALLDPLVPALPRPGRLAEGALSASVERDVHLHALTRSSALDAALFVAGSSRWDPSPDAHAEGLTLVAAGIGLRLVSAHPDHAAPRLDLGIPLVRSAGVRRGIYVGLSLTPPALAGRQRVGRGLP